MILIPIALMIVGFFAGMRVASRYAPPLADTRTRHIATSLVDLVVGLAIAIFFLTLFLAARAVTSGTMSDWDEADALARELSYGLGSVGLLLALAATVHLLAPPPDVDD